MIEAGVFGVGVIVVKINCVVVFAAAKKPEFSFFDEDTAIVRSITEFLMRVNSFVILIKEPVFTWFTRALCWAGVNSVCRSVGGVQL